MRAVLKAVNSLGVFFILTLIFLAVPPQTSEARNIIQYKDTISNSAPSTASNHTLNFILNTTISPGAYIEVTPPVGFTTQSTSTFTGERNVELLVNGTARDATTVQSSTNDMVEIVPGSPGLIRYTLNTTQGINSGSTLELKIGNNTSESLTYSQSFSTTTGTTTVQADIKPIINSETTGTHKVKVRIYDGGQVADADFTIVLIDQVGVGPIDTTEEIPPLRFNGAPSSTVTGVTSNVEIFVETDEFAICRLGTTPDVDYFSMSTSFTNTGLLYHTSVVAVTPETTVTYYVRCIDDEGNFNPDDYIIEFYVTETPSGTANDEGDVQGDGTGSGNDGTGTGDGGGGETGASDGETPTTGGQSGGGGSGGGGGGGSGEDDDSSAGGGFENPDAPYRSGDGRVVITGYAYPNSTVHVLVDGKAVSNTRAAGSGQYSITVDEIARGVYTFGVYALDSADTRSTTFSTSFTVTGARTSSLSNINLPPTVKATPDPVTPGGTLTLSGFTLPNATVTLENEKEGSAASKQILTVTASANGAWSTGIETGNFKVGTYKARAKAKQEGGTETNFSNHTFYGVGQSADRPVNSDFNRDGKVNLVDFSILLFWWGTDGGTSDPSADINGDGKVNLVDFSILLFGWTG